MSETPVVLYKEVPVPEPNLFLLYKENLAFVKREHDVPVGVGTKDDMSKMTLGVGASFICGVGAFSLGAMLGAPGCLVVGFVLPAIILLFTFRKDGNVYPLAGWILPGEIVASEQITEYSGHYTAEKYIIDYRFTTTQGEACAARAIGFLDDTNYNEAPPVGTPVRVWFPDDGTPTLL